MKYSNDEWAKCRWRIDLVPEGELCYEHFPEIGDIFKPIIKNYHEDFPIDTLIRYIILVYHRNSPYARNEGNVIKRKIDVFELLALNPEDKQIKELIANQFNPAVVATIHFLKQENSLDWFELQVLTETYYQTMFTLLDNSEDVGKKTGIEIAEKKNKVVQQFKTTKMDIQMLSDKIFSNDGDLLNHYEKYKKAEEDNFVILSPEDFIRSKRTSE